METGKEHETELGRMKQILLSILLSLSAMAGEIATVEHGTPVYNTAPVLSLSQSGISPLQQAEKIAAWIEEVADSVAKHGESVPAAVILSLIEREIERLAK
jgi:hypothetical protein